MEDSNITIGKVSKDFKKQVETLIKQEVKKETSLYKKEIERLRKKISANEENYNKKEKMIIEKQNKINISNEDFMQKQTDKLNNYYYFIYEKLGKDGIKDFNDFEKQKIKNID